MTRPQLCRDALRVAASRGISLTDGAVRAAGPLLRPLARRVTPSGQLRQTSRCRPRLPLRCKVDVSDTPCWYIGLVLTLFRTLFRTGTLVRRSTSYTVTSGVVPWYIVVHTSAVCRSTWGGTTRCAVCGSLCWRRTTSDVNLCVYGVCVSGLPASNALKCRQEGGVFSARCRVVRVCKQAPSVPPPGAANVKRGLGRLVSRRDVPLRCVRLCWCNISRG